MMEEGTLGWRNANEDSVSTCSSEDRASVGTRGTSSERRLLRLPNMVRAATSTKLKTSVTIGTFLVVMIGASAFGIVYTRTSGVNEEFLAHHEVIRSAIVPDIDELSSISKAEPRLQQKKDTELGDMQMDDPRAYSNPSANRPQIVKRNTSSSATISSNTSPGNSVGIQGQVNPDNSTIVTTPKNKKRKTRRNKHRPRKLPEHAQEKPALSLLLQMKLVQPPTNSYVNYTHCADRDSGKELQIGWKAFIFVNATLAGIPADKNRFTGYGKTKADARRTASQCALKTIYKDAKLEYEYEDLTLIIKYCDDDEDDEEVDDNRRGCYN